MIDFGHVKKNETKTYTLLKEGEYKFTIFSAIEKTSKSGNPMIELILFVIDSNGRHFYIKDWIVFSENTLDKVEGLCLSINLMDKYNEKKIDQSDLLDKVGMAYFFTKKGQQKPDGSFYEDRTSVKKYLVESEQEKRINETLEYYEKLSDTSAINQPIDKTLNDDLPF